MATEKYEITVRLDNIVQSRFLNMTAAQRLFWNRLKRLLDEKGGVMVCDVAKLLVVPYSSAKNWVKLYEGLGLISGRMVGREKLIQLRKDPPVTVDKRMLQHAFDEWCKKRNIS